MKLENLVHDKLIMRCRGGASLFDSKREAAWLALEQEVAVEFEHNGTTYFANPDHIVEAVKGRPE